MLMRILPFLLPPALVADPVPAPSWERVLLAMGTELHLRLGGQGDLSKAPEAALSEVARIEAACSTWNPESSWSRLNAAQGRPVVLDREWIDLLGQAQTWRTQTGGAFDPALMALVQAWGLRMGGQTPDGSTLAEARRASGGDLLELDPVAGTARLAHPAAGVEEGGFLKGYALDRMRQAAATSSGCLDFGGQLLAWGRPVSVSVADPVNRQRPRLSFLLRNASLSGSGTSERGRHLLDPRTGVPCPAWGSTAVVAADGLMADILSTALYVMGPEAGLVWAERQGVAAAFLLNDGTIRISPAFRSLHPTLIPQEFR